MEHAVSGATSSRINRCLASRSFSSKRRVRKQRYAESAVSAAKEFCPSHGDGSERRTPAIARVTNSTSMKSQSTLYC